MHLRQEVGCCLLLPATDQGGKGGILLLATMILVLRHTSLPLLVATDKGRWEQINLDCIDKTGILPRIEGQQSTAGAFDLSG